jgi:uncharacterized protein (DUF58 family)
MTQISVPPVRVSPYLNLRALATLRHLRFTTRRRTIGAYSGRHRSAQQGGAGEFMDYREYVDGEDLRRLDWKVLARSGRAYVRLYVDETNLRCTLALDASSSMLFNGRRKTADEKGSKLEYARYLATAMSHVISAQQDQVGLAVMADGLRDLQPPAATQRHVTAVQARIAEMKASPKSDLAEGLQTLISRLTRRGVLLLMSDFLVDDMEKLFAAIRLYQHRRWEVVLIHLVHPMEERLPSGPAFRFEGLENDGRVDCSPMEIAAEYERRFEAHCSAVRSLGLACGCDYRRVSTATPYLQTLSSFLVERTA